MLYVLTLRLVEKHAYSVIIFRLSIQSFEYALLHAVLCYLSYGVEVVVLVVHCSLQNRSMISR